MQLLIFVGSGRTPSPIFVLPGLAMAISGVEFLKVIHMPIDGEMRR